MTLSYDDARCTGRRSLQHARERVTNASQHLRDPGTYDGAELRPFEGRPGAMDAYGLPSLIGVRRVWRRA